MNTGCDYETCQTKEVQKFTCAADTGKFGIQLEDQFIMNVDVTTSHDALKILLESFIGINEVSVTYEEVDDRQYSRGDRVCTSQGNEVTITFENVSFPEYDGNVPQLVYDIYNEANSLRTTLSQGMESTPLAGVNVAFLPYITPSTVTDGVQQRDSVATFVSGNGTDVLSFAYRVRANDFSTMLDVTAIQIEEGYIYSPVTFSNISTFLPNLGGGPRYVNSAPGSLSFAKTIIIYSAQPVVVNVSSTDGAYTQGDTITIYVNFDLPIRVYGGSNIIINLDTGTFVRQATFVEQSSANSIALAYTVLAFDTSGALDYIGTDSLVLNGGIIYRDALTNETLASITLPTPTSDASLSKMNSITVNTQSPVVISITATSAIGTYTAGEYIDIDVVQ